MHGRHQCHISTGRRAGGGRKSEAQWNRQRREGPGRCQGRARRLRVGGVGGRVGGGVGRGGLLTRACGQVGTAAGANARANAGVRRDAAIGRVVASPPTLTLRRMLPRAGECSVT
jgi:hypothetical protein